MMGAVLLGFASGAMTANAIPHYVSGTTAQPYPTVFGNSPTTNAVAGWAGLVGAGLLAHYAVVGGGRKTAEFAGTVGALAAALYHARGGPARLNALLGR